MHAKLCPPKIHITKSYPLVPQTVTVFKDACMYAKLLQSCQILCDFMGGRPPGLPVHGILQARILEWVAMPSFRESCQPRDRTCIFYVSCISRQVLYHQCHLGSPIFGDKILKLKRGFMLWGWVIIQSDWCPYKGRVGHRHTVKTAVSKPRREASEESIPEDTLISEFQPPELRHFLLSKPRSLWDPL